MSTILRLLATWVNMIITLTNVSSCVAVAGGIIVCNLSLGLENAFFGSRGERSFRQSLDLTILYSDLQIFRLNKNIKCIPQNEIIKKKNNRYCKNVEHLLFCYSLNKFTNLNCRFLQLFTPRICGLSSLSRKKKTLFHRS